MTHQYRRIAVISLIAAALLANPLYVGAVVPDSPDRKPTGYTVTKVNPDNPQDQRKILRQLGDEEVVDVSNLATANTDHRPNRYRVPETAARKLVSARDTEQPVTVSNQTTQRTLERLDASSPYAQFNRTGAYYTFGLDSPSTGAESAELTVTRVETETVADYVIAQDTVLYSSYRLSDRVVLDSLLRNMDDGYRPLENENAVQFTDVLIVKDGSTYLVKTSYISDDFGPEPVQTISFILSVTGAIAFLTAVAAFLLREQ